ncbi:MAG: molybdopterin-dependent oxidoreductase [Chloroflexi bacterium]|nr:molybdopterin-dependent oxidoreductase [Chloroflexota bacterium]
MSSSKKAESSRSGISRRAFLKASAVTGVAVAASRIVKYPGASAPVSSSENTEGVITEKWVATSCLNCPVRCATRVRVVNGKAVKIDGNPLSQFSDGEICPRGHIGLQVLYDPDRVSNPLRRTNPAKGKGVDPGWAPISWSEALSEVSSHLKSLRSEAQPHRLLLLHGLNTTSDEDIIHRFAEAYGTPNIVNGESLENEAEVSGRWMADGNRSHVGYDLGRTNYVLAFGASIIESERPLARNLRLWGKIRREKPNRTKVVVIDPRYSVTAARSDQWLPINAGTDGALAMAIANVIIGEELYDTEFIKNWAAGFAEYRELVLRDYSPEKVASLLGIDAEVIRQIAREFAQTKPAIAWIGRGAVGWPNGSYNSYAIFCLNALVGSIDAPGGVIYQEEPKYRAMPGLAEDDIARAGRAWPRLDWARTKQFPAAEMVTNQVPDSIIQDMPYPVAMAIGFNSNFSMSAPATRRWDDALKKVPYYIHIAPFVSEMAEYADIILPSPTFMEEWAYDHAPPGSGFAEVKIKQPVVEPQHDTRSITDIVFEIAERLGGTVARSFSGIGDNAEGFVRYRTENILPWSEFREKGVWIGPPYRYQLYGRIFNTPSKKFEFYSGNLENQFKNVGKDIGNRVAYLPYYDEVQFLGEKTRYPLVLSTYQPVLTIESGNQNYPWAQELLLVMYGLSWTNFVEINSQTAHTLGIKDKDTVWVESQFGRIKGTARVIEGIHPQVVGIADAQGHYAGGRWQKNLGVNPNEIIGLDYDYLSGQSSFFNTRVKVYRA